MILELETQFQMIIVSVIFAMVFTNIFTFIEIVLSKLRFIVVPIYFLTSTLMYYIMIYKISNGVLSVYLPLCLICGYYLHMRFYDKYFSCIYNYWFSRISSIIKTRKDRCKKQWIGHNLKKMKKEENLIE